ncbi:MAG TPA: hypothetical protein VKR27_08615 [Acidimicrobiales bacterium]|nr:hypothetical protein [Acidimicrobiales bacterium]
MKGRRVATVVLAVLAAAAGGLIVAVQPFTSGTRTGRLSALRASAIGQPSCVLQGPTGPVRHVIEITFDNVHFTRDNPNVPSDLEQIPSLLNFIENKGALLSNEHTPLIAHTADDILTTLTGVYGSTHGQPVANDYRTYNTITNSSDSESSFAYWTDPVTNSNATDTAPTMDDGGKVMPAPWVSFTRAGCDVGAFGTANMEIENPGTDLPVIFGPGSPEVQQYNNDPNPFKDQEVADYEGISVHCSQASDSVCARSTNAVSDKLTDEPGGYIGYDGLFGNKFVAPVVGGTGAGGQIVTDLGGTPITDPYTGTPGFPGFDPTASQTLGYIAAMQEHGIPVTYGYIEDTHENFATGNAAGPGDPAHESNLVADNNAFATFFARLQRDGITKKNTLFIFSSDEGDHFSGTRTLTPAGCDGVTTFCTFPQGTIGELQASVNGLLKEHFTGAPTDYQIEADTAPNFYVNGNPAPGGADERTLEQDLGQLTFSDPYTSSTVPFTNFLADKTEENILHMVTADPLRTPTFTDFANTDLYVEKTSGTSCPSPSSGDTATSDPCILINPGFAWEHGDVAPEINTNWLGIVGPGVKEVGLDSQTWADETDVRPTLMYLTGLKDDYAHSGRVLFEDLRRSAIPGGLHDPDNFADFLQLGATYKQLEAGVGQFGMDTLAASTIGLESTSPTVYSNMETALSNLGAQRDALATTIESDLENVEFNGATISEHLAKELTAQAQQLINEAAALS